jgi:1-acyl-sn-glycerol-3-phosphate acyltransferase
MDRPRIAVDNPAVYEYYSNLPSDPEFMQKFHKLCATLLHSQVILAPGTREAAGHHLGEGNPALILLGHATWLDPAFIAGAMHEEPELNSIIGNVVIPANAPYFEKPFFGWLFDRGRAIPAFRTKDVHGEGGGVTDESLEEARKEARRALAKLCISNIDNNTSVAMFPEAHRNRGDRTKVLKIKGTPVKITEGVKTPSRLMVVAMMPYYGNRWVKNLFRPTMGIGHIDPARTSELTLEDLRLFQQSTLDMAVNAYEARSHKRLFG